MREVCVAAWPRVTKVSREIIWLSRMPAPSKPADSIDWIRRISSGMGAVPGTRMWTRTGAVMENSSPGAVPRVRSFVARPPLLAERGHSLREMGARPHLVAQLLLERLAAARVIGDGRADLPLHRLHRGRAVGRDRLRGLERPRHQAVGGDHAVDQPKPRGLRRVDQ